MKRDSFIFYRSFYESINELDKETRVQIYDAIADYSLNLIEPNLKGIERSIFILIKPQLDANIKRFMNGSKPKAKRKQKESKPKAKKMQVEKVIQEVSENKFNLFWEQYHKLTGKPKTDRKTSEKYWSKLSDKEKHNAIYFINDYAMTQKTNKYLKKARTYLADKTFNDEFVEFRNIEQNGKGATIREIAEITAKQFGIDKG